MALIEALTHILVIVLSFIFTLAYYIINKP